MSESGIEDKTPANGASVRSLPPRRMQNIKSMFEGNFSNQSTSSPNQPSNDTESQGQTTQSKFESPDGSRTGSPVRRWRQHIEQPKHVDEQNQSPRRRPKPTISPSRLNDDDFPKPSPRKSLHINNANESSRDTDRGLAGLPFKQFGELAGAVVDTAAERPTEKPRVSRLVNQMDTGTAYHNTDALNRPLPAKRTDLSPKRFQGSNKTSDDKTPQQKAEQNFKHEGESEYGKIWNGGNGQTMLDVKKTEENKRPVSVMDRLRMFEKTENQSPSVSQNTDNSSPLTKPAKLPTSVSSNTNSSSPLTKPVKPPPPYRQRSFTDNSTKTVEKEAKIPPKRPPFRQTSLVEKSSNGHETEPHRVTFVDPVDADIKPTPPRKPARTHAHDDYIQVKLEKGQTDKTQVQTTEEDIPDSQTDFSNENTFPRSSVRKNKPTRPPPPRKPRPFSIAVDSMDFSNSNSDSSDSEKNHSMHGNSTFYESLTFEKTHNTNDQIQHWDLPRVNHPEPIRRSLSSDCIPKAVNEDGNVIYMEPEKIGLSSSGGFDIYVDDTGYAVPHRIVMKSKSSTSSETENSRPIGDRFKSKLKKFKNLFSEQDKNVGLERGDIGRGSQKWKVDAIKQKVDQAFDVLRGSIKNRDMETVENNYSSDGATGTDTDSKVDEKEIRKRLEYSRSVRIKTSKSIKESRRLKDTRYPQLFEHAMIVGLELGEDSSIYKPVMKYKFPEIRNYKLTMEGKLFPLVDGKDSNVSVPLFCFPDAANFKPSSSSSKSQSYNFVLTNIDGGRVYGYCRRIVPPKSPNKVPEVICIISPVNAFKMYNTLLEEIEIKRRLSMDSAQELIAAAFGRPLPAPGQSETIRTLDQDGEMETLFLTREADNRVENVNCECVLTNLGADKMLKVFATILNERSVLFCAKNLSNLSSTINGITSLLYPFSWQHTFIPVLPAEMIDVICSPTPYIIGITSTLTAEALKLPLDEYVLIVDLDKKSFLRSQGDEGILLPSKMTKALKTSINMCRVDSEAKSMPDLMICEAFLRFFIEVVGHYGQYIITERDGNKTFQKDDFVKGASSSSLQQLLRGFVETQMFEVFTTEQIEKKEWGNTIEFFQNRVQEVRYNPSRQFKRRLGKKLS